MPVFKRVHKLQTFNLEAFFLRILLYCGQWKFQCACATKYEYSCLVWKQWATKCDCSRLDPFFSKLLKTSPLLLFGLDHLIWTPESHLSPESQSSTKPLCLQHLICLPQLDGTKESKETKSRSKLPSNPWSVWHFPRKVLEGFQK